MEPTDRDTRIREAWEADRGYLLTVAGRMVGYGAAAEDAVQEAFARLAGAPVGQIDDVRGWLVVVTRRICLDRMGSADARRTTVTDWTQDVVQAGLDPSDRVTLDDEVRRALTVVIDRLSPAERTSFILHDVFGFPFGAVAELVGRTPAACRQLASRARASIRGGSFDPLTPVGASMPAAATDLARRFIAACEGGDVRGLIDLLDPNAAGSATVMGAPPLAPARGAAAVAERALFFFGPASGVSLEPFGLEGTAAVVARQRSQVVAVVRLDEAVGRIVHLHAIARRFSRAPR